MKNLVRGAIVLSIVGMFVAVFYAQTRTDRKLSSAKDSQTKYINSFIDSEFVIDNVLLEDHEAQLQDQDKDKKLVEKTVLTRSAGLSKGSFSATAYCLRGRTAMGHGVRSGIIAADPRVLRLGSKVNINGGGYSGTYLVSDTGSRVKGRKIDIWVPSCAEARRFGRRNVNISVPN